MLIYKNEPIAKLTSNYVKFDQFNQKLISYYKDKKLKTKIIIFEYENTPNRVEDLSKKLKIRNQLHRYKDPLVINYQNEVRDSLMTDQTKVVDYSGFFNLLLIFSVLNYSRLIITHYIKYKNQLFGNLISILKVLFSPSYFVFLV